MPKVTYNGTVIAESSETVVLEGNQYFPPSSIEEMYFKPSETKYTCPWKGACDYYDGDINGETVSDIAWYYPNPKPAASNIKGYLAFDKKKVKFE